MGIGTVAGTVHNSSKTPTMEELMQAFPNFYLGQKERQHDSNTTNYGLLHTWSLSDRWSFTLALNQA
jgi:hypothetical protein